MTFIRGKSIMAQMYYNQDINEKVLEGKKSYSVSFTLQDETQTLTDKAIDKTMQRLISVFEKDLGAVIRR